MNSAGAFLGDCVAITKLVEAVRYHVEGALCFPPGRSAPGALVRDLVVDSVVLTEHFVRDPGRFASAVFSTAEKYVHALGLGAVSNLVDASDDYASAVRPRRRCSHLLDDVDEAPRLLDTLRRQLASGNASLLLREVALTVGAWRGPTIRARPEVCDERLTRSKAPADVMAEAEALRARLAHTTVPFYRAAIASLLHGGVAWNRGHVAPQPTQTTVTTAAAELFSLTPDGAATFFRERLSGSIGQTPQVVTPTDVAAACRSALTLLGQARLRATPERYLEIPGAMPCRSLPIASLDAVLVVARERRRLFGEPVSLRYNNGMTAMTYLIRMLRLVPDYVRLAATNKGRVVGFVAALPLTRSGYSTLTSGSKSIYAFVDHELVEPRPGRAYTVLVQNLISRLEGSVLSETQLGLNLLERVVRDGVARCVDRSGGGPMAVATAANLAGRAVLLARGFERVGETPHKTPIFEYRPQKTIGA